MRPSENPTEPVRRDPAASPRQPGIVEREVPLRQSTEPVLHGDLVLPPPGHLPQTGPVDYVDHYYGGGMGMVLRERLRWVRDALPASVGSVLEIGYGSGVFMYTLASRAKTLFGIDIHAHGAAVSRQLDQDGIHLTAAQGSGMTLPYRNGAFDAVVIVSALEFMDDPKACLVESLRVTRPGGRVVCVTPRILRWADALYRTLVGIDPETDFKGGRQRVQRALADLPDHPERHPRPRRLPSPLAPYELVLLHKR